VESFTNLYRASKDAAVKHRLEELVELCADTVIDAERGCAFQFFERDWTPLPAPASYGHDIELSWLLTEAVHAGEIGNASSIHEISLFLAKSVAENGLDRERGGVWYEGDRRNSRLPERGPWWVRAVPPAVRPWLVRWRTRRRKIWWVQAEALVGFLNAYALSGDGSFIEAFSNVQNWVFSWQVDSEYGEWHNEITSGGRYRGAKGSLWKTAYHTARACLEVVRRLDGLRVKTPTGTPRPAAGARQCNLST
jgi:mannobiose 2-epimerase